LRTTGSAGATLRQAVSKYVDRTVRKKSARTSSPGSVTIRPVVAAGAGSVSAPTLLATSSAPDRRQRGERHVLGLPSDHDRRILGCRSHEGHRAGARVTNAAPKHDAATNGEPERHTAASAC